MAFSFHVPGHPVPKARPRMGRGGRWYTPRRTREYQQKVAEWGLAARPKGWRRFGQFGVVVAAGGFRGDLDNVVKVVLDALRGVAWMDDRDVVAIKSFRVSQVGLWVSVERRVGG